MEGKTRKLYICSKPQSVNVCCVYLKVLGDPDGTALQGAAQLGDADLEPADAQEAMPWRIKGTTKPVSPPTSSVPLGGVLPLSPSVPTSDDKS